MPRMEAGRVREIFEFGTPLEEGRSLEETVLRAEGKTALMFLRYYGCTLCQYDIHRLAASYSRIRETGGQVLVVLQSDREGLKKQLKADSLPFELICDPEQRLYERFQICPAASKEEMMGANTMAKIELARAGGFEHGAYEGNELQLPAVFIMDQERKLTYAHYGISVDDVPDPGEFRELLK